MTEILTITLNPALDLSTSAPQVVPGPKLRCAAPVVEPGGGGINVSRVVHILGGASRCLVALGGKTGERLGALLGAAGLDVVAMPAPGETRQSLAVTDDGSGAQYRFVLPGPRWGEGDVAAALQLAQDTATANAIVVVSGSAPPGVPVDFTARLTAALTPQGARVIADTSGAALAHLAEGGRAAMPEILRMDSEEAEGLAGRALPERRDSADFAASLVARGAARQVIVARGADGSVLASGDGHWHVLAADVPVRSKIGAGDSFVGAFTFALARGDTPDRALAWGQAAASATVTTEGTQLCPRALVQELLPACPVTPL
ncbi:1-phosphofructokinase family hexose kinase [Thalassococcus sp. CAU 1522]|uniref:Phosphofructokinase n=1 Tax=Thalassococcus arenae TaxID=2851652 RepID=A0ABS6N5K0_9RHOB|nr:1-phosphofructokinase family hexose kinase [Thalassococcus arenae]MBV2359298.1 1-phosphofructokinase family hexose kinase [Thalassococcus arenae]